MKKRTSNKNTIRPATANPAAVRATPKQKTYNPWSMSIYVYWFIILFFIAATFYILGRSHGVLNHRVSTNNNAVITEEMFLSAADYYESGKTKLIAGEIEDAIVDLTAAIDAGAPTAEMYTLRGEAYMQGANYRGALDDFNTAIEMEPTSSVAYYDRALLNTRLEDFNSAMGDINNALAAYVSKPNEILQLRDLYAKRGQLNLWIKNWEGAIADYTNSLARPEGTVSPSVYAERAEAYTAMGEYALAVNDYTSAIRVISEQIQGATTMEQKEDLSMRAMNYFEKSAALNLNIGNTAAAKSDLESAYAIAASLNDADTTERLQKLIEALQ